MDDYDVLNFQQEAIPDSGSEGDPNEQQQEDDLEDFAYRRLPRPPTDVLSLQQAWVGEVCAPELLVYKSVLLDKMQERLQQQQAHVDEYRCLHVYSLRVLGIELTSSPPQLQNPCARQHRRYVAVGFGIQLTLMRASCVRCTSHRSAGTEEMYTASLYQMELDRMRYSITKYLRTRLLKIEQNVFYIISQAKDMISTGRLSDK